MKRRAALFVFLLLACIPRSYGADVAVSYVELADQPTIAVDWSKGNTQSVTLGGNRVLTFSNGQKGWKYLLIVKQDATGSRTITWSASVRWPGGAAPMLTATAGKSDYVTFFYNGVSYDAVGLAQNY